MQAVLTREKVDGVSMAEKLAQLLGITIGYLRDADVVVVLAAKEE